MSMGEGHIVAGGAGQGAHAVTDRRSASSTKHGGSGVAAGCKQGSPTFRTRLVCRTVLYHQSNLTGSKHPAVGCWRKRGVRKQSLLREGMPALELGVSGSGSECAHLWN